MTPADFALVPIQLNEAQRFREEFLPLCRSIQAKNRCKAGIKSALSGYRGLGLSDSKSRYDFAASVKSWLDAIDWLNRSGPKKPLYPAIPLSNKEQASCRLLKLLSMLEAPDSALAVQNLSLSEIHGHQWLTVSDKMAGHHPVRIVDDEKIRNESLKHEEFVEYAIHDDFPDMIPKGEIWIAESVPEEERRYFIDAAMTEIHSLEQGYSSEVAYERGLNVQKAERAKNKGKFKKGKKPDKQDYGTIDDRGETVKVYLVKGKQIRDLFKADWSQGGHGYVYTFVPKDEIWLDQDLMHDELPFILLHEATERSLMKRHGLKYDKAHEIASDVEDHRRHEAPPTQWLAWQASQSRSGGIKAIWTGPGFRVPLYGAEAEAALRAQEQSGTPTEPEALKKHVQDVEPVDEATLTPEQKTSFSARKALDQVLKRQQGVESPALDDVQLDAIAKGLPTMSPIEIKNYRDKLQHETKDLFGPGTIRDMMIRSIIRSAKRHHIPTVYPPTEEGGRSVLPPPGTTQTTTGPGGAPAPAPQGGTPPPEPNTGIINPKPSGVPGIVSGAVPTVQKPLEHPAILQTAKNTGGQPADLGKRIRALYDRSGDVSIPMSEIESTMAPLRQIGKSQLLLVARDMELVGMERKSATQISQAIKQKVLDRRSGAQRSKMIQDRADQADKANAAVQPGEPNATPEGQEQSSVQVQRPEADRGGKEAEAGAGDSLQRSGEVQEEVGQYQPSPEEIGRMKALIREENERQGRRRAPPPPLPIEEDDEEDYYREASKLTSDVLNGLVKSARQQSNQPISPEVQGLVSEQLGDRIEEELRRRPLNRAALLRSLGSNESDFDSAVEKMKSSGKIEVFRAGLGNNRLFYRLLKPTS